MATEYIRKQDGVSRISDLLVLELKMARCPTWNEVYNAIGELPPANVVPYSIAPDGTLTITVPKGTKRIGRILIEEDGTQYGGMFYPDTGGCFLSSMERIEYG